MAPAGGLGRGRPSRRRYFAPSGESAGENALVSELVGLVAAGLMGFGSATRPETWAAVDPA
jgi:hypothetical protein